MSSKDRAQDRQKRFHAHGLLQNGFRLARRKRNGRVTCDYDDWNALFLQSINQAVGPLAVSQIDIDNGDVGSALGKKSFGVSDAGSWAGDIRSQYPK